MSWHQLGQCSCGIGQQLRGISSQQIESLSLFIQPTILPHHPFLSHTLHHPSSPFSSDLMGYTSGWLSFSPCTLSGRRQTITFFLSTSQRRISWPKKIFFSAEIGWILDHSSRLGLCVFVACDVFEFIECSWWDIFFSSLQGVSTHIHFRSKQAIMTWHTLYHTAISLWINPWIISYLTCFFLLYTTAISHHKMICLLHPFDLSSQFSFVLLMYHHNIYILFRVTTVSVMR